jgi:hypothetical protein
VLALDTNLHRRPNQVVEKEGAVYQRCKSKHLQPLERFPAETKGDHPDEEGAAGVDGRPRRSADGSSDRKAKEVEASVVR